MLQVNCQVLVELVHVSLLLVDHGTYQVKLLHILGVIRVLETLRQLFVDDS